jgi:hypothetical protein
VADTNPTRTFHTTTEQDNKSTSAYSGRGPDYVVYVFTSHDNIIVCRLYKLTFSDQAQVILQLRVGLPDSVSRFSACSPFM